MDIPFLFCRKKLGEVDKSRMAILPRVDVGPGDAPGVGFGREMAPALGAVPS